MIRLLLALLFLPWPDPAAASADGDPSIIPLAEIQPGDTGEWRTAVSGREVRSFPLEVVGVLESFAGPGMPIILCRATDAVNTATGPVSGMSGSPVYIDGRLAGAYAYGFPWSKEKTLIGVTPIEWMLPLLERPDQPYRESQGNPTPAPAESQATLGLPAGPEAVPAAADSGGPVPLPVPLLASGVAPRTLRAISPWLEGKGLRLTAGAAGGGASESGVPYEPGSPLSVILADGDLRIGGVGTVTWVDGNRFLAFGHPMLGSGSVELPVGGAEIVDVVANYRISFKLSNIGGVEGTLWQDSTSGIQGEFGRVPYMVPIRISSDAGVESPVEGRLAEHRRFTPTMALVYAAQTLFAAEEGPDESTLTGTLTVRLEGEEEPLSFERRGVGFAGALDVLFHFADNLNLLLNGTQEFPRIAEIDVDLRTRNEEKIQILHALRLETSRLRSGENVRLEIQTRQRDGALARHRIEIPLPPDAAGEDFTVFVADADSLRSFDQLAQYDPSRGLDELITEMRQLRGNGAIHVQLLRPLPGLRLEGRNLENLPPSVLRLYQSSLRFPGDPFLSESVVWEETIPVPGVFAGNARLEFQTEP